MIENKEKNGCNTDSDQREKGQKKEDKLLAQNLGLHLVDSTVNW